MHPQPFAINIGRQLGSGGRAIGRLLADSMGARYLDRELLTLAADRSGLSPEIFERTDEHKGFLHTLAGSLFPAFSAHTGYYDESVNDDTLFRLQSEAIRRAAQEAPCIIIGRCADYVLRDMPRTVNVFVVADRRDRIARLCRMNNITEAEAARRIDKGDQRRAEYYNFYTQQRWGAAETYDLCLNTSLFGIERTAEIIRQFAEEKLAAVEARMK
ncbi:MAG: cytidylate kinase-like family protein [Alloprevotella sp.]|nr:cytidylate kinase-like family protein [Bacteroidales bacterium]MDY2605135.1 cytidylate kinase-like family protein [Alloprevotella sp.]MCI6104664.1 cytidylate kinase-like family protein [Bacteroidales bacterium]MCI6252709.1 cytidylate kinase-like family protein [Bacteroidales bacterium]MCI7645255.1 cytidylate kinase-like family protein [Bacteroidales bacterium]